MTRLLLILACATSAGIHAALTPAHLADSRLLGLSFAAATASLVAVALLLVWRPTPGVALGAGALFAALIVAWLATRVAEPVDALGLVAKGVESGGLLLAVALAHGAAGERTRHRTASVALTLVVAAVVAVATPAPTHAHAPAGGATTPHGH